MSAISNNCIQVPRPRVLALSKQNPEPGTERHTDRATFMKLMLVAMGGGHLLLALIAVAFEDPNSRGWIALWALFGAIGGALTTWYYAGQDHPKSLAGHSIGNVLSGFFIGTPAAVFLIPKWTGIAENDPFQVMFTTYAISCVGLVIYKAWTGLMNVDFVRSIIANQLGIKLPEKSEKPAEKPTVAIAGDETNG